MKDTKKIVLPGIITGLLVLQFIAIYYVMNPSAKTGDTRSEASSYYEIMNNVQDPDTQTTFADLGEAENPIQISTIAVSNITKTTADLSWTTTSPTKTIIEFGLEKQNLEFGSDLNEAPTTQHQTTLINLSPDTTYYFRAIVIDEKNHIKKSNVQDFKTIAE